MALISLRIPDDVAARLAALAATEGGKSALLRRLITEALDVRAPSTAPLPIGRPEKVTLRFRESEMRRLAEVAHQRGMTRTHRRALELAKQANPAQHKAAKRDRHSGHVG